MSINEVIKKHLPIGKKKLFTANKQYNYCSAYSYQNCKNCKEIKRIRCCKKLTYQAVQQVEQHRWHFYFYCLQSHLVIRWVIIENNRALVGQLKN